MTEQSNVPETILAIEVAPSDVKSKSGLIKNIELSDDEKARAQALQKAIDGYYKDIPALLRHSKESQEACLQFLLEAEQNLTLPLSRIGIIEARQAVTRVQIEMDKVRSASFSFTVVAVIVYMFVIAIVAAFYYGLVDVGSPAGELNKKLVMGMPLPIMVWSVIGSFTSMLLRAGQLPFLNPTEAMRWVLFRPIVGVVMGLLTYLMVITGLIVFAGNGNVQTPELLWIIAFIGSFSDTLSIGLLQKIVGKFQHSEPPSALPDKPDKQDS